MASLVALRAGFSAHHAALDWDGTFPDIEEKLRLTARTMRSCYIGGALGTGKTAFLAIMLKEAFRQQALQSQFRTAHVEPSAFLQGGIFVLTHSGLMDFVHQALRADDEVMLYRLYTAKLVIVDDLGTGHEDAAGFNTGQFERVVDYRWSHDLPLWISSNVDCREWSQDPQWKRIYSRWQDRRWMPAGAIWIDGELTGNRRKGCKVANAQKRSWR